MSRTHSYLTKRLGTLRAHAAGTANEVRRLQRQHEAELAELAEVETALAAVDALAPDPDSDEAIAEAMDAAEAETPEETDRG